jgi:diguanylate cyclase (GGDEF)-like protein
MDKRCIVDNLTGIYSTKYLFELLRREYQRSERHGVFISCLMMDIDHLKRVNDSYGHQTGDRVLKEIGAVLTEVVRGYDFAARYGGDEFTIILPQQKVDNGVKVVAERVRAAVESHLFLDGPRMPNGGIKITISIGTATFPGKGINSDEELINQADQALYDAKKGGRNCVVISP